jgi:hypothetical protein
MFWFSRDSRHALRRGPMLPQKLLTVAILALAACGGDPQGRAVAAVDGQVLTPDRLLGYMARTRASSADPSAVADAIAEGWLDLALVAEAAGRGVTPADSALQSEVLAPLVRTQSLQRLQNALAATRPLRDEELNRQFRGDSLRLFQLALVRVPDWSDASLVRSRQARADSIAALLQAGARFDQVAARFSEAPGAPAGGYQGLVTKDGVPDRWREALWSLPPNGISPVLTTSRGFEIFRRPPFQEVRAQFAAGLLRAAGARADSILADSLSSARGLALLPSTAERLRAVLTNPDSLAPDTAWIVGFDDGGVAPE